MRSVQCVAYTSLQIGPVFRAENSNTHRHLTEYTGLDLEMTINQSHHELINVVDQVLKSIFVAVQSMPELAIIRERFPSSDLVWLEDTLVLSFADGIRMLWQDGVHMDEDEDLSTRNEIRLGQLVKEKYNTVSKLHRERFEQVKSTYIQCIYNCNLLTYPRAR